MAKLTKIKTDKAGNEHPKSECCNATLWSIQKRIRRVIFCGECGEVMDGNGKHLNINVDEKELKHLFEEIDLVEEIKLVAELENLKS